MVDWELQFIGRVERYFDEGKTGSSLDDSRASRESIIWGLKDKKTPVKWIPKNEEATNPMAYLNAAD